MATPSKDVSIVDDEDVADDLSDISDAHSSDRDLMQQLESPVTGFDDDDDHTVRWAVANTICRAVGSGPRHHDGYL